MTIRIRWALGMLLLLLALGAHGEERRPAFDANYAIEAELYPEARRVVYTETAMITNTGTAGTDALYFHIYGNKFKDGNIEVLAVGDGDGNGLEFDREQEGILYRVALARELTPGTSVEVTFDCEVLIPDMEDMYGISAEGDIQLPLFSVQLAMYSENGWDTAPIQTNGDGRFAAVADYDLTVRVPEGYAVVCNGNELSRETGEGVTAYSYRAENRRDIVLFACEDYAVLERTVGRTTIKGYFNEKAKGVTPQAMELAMDSAAFSLEYYRDVFAEYPHDTLVVVSMGNGYAPVGSMEYPGLVAILFNDGDSDTIKAATYHEVAHQWFYGLVGSDENREPWLDESFAEFAAGLCLEAGGDDSDPYWNVRDWAAKASAGEKVNVPADAAGDYVNVMYGRGAMFLKALMDAVGREDFLAILSRYCREYTYGIATTEDFLGALYAGTDADVSGIVAEYIR